MLSIVLAGHTLILGVSTWQMIQILKPWKWKIPWGSWESTGVVSLALVFASSPSLWHCPQYHFPSPHSPSCHVLPRVAESKLIRQLRSFIVRWFWKCLCHLGTCCSCKVGHGGQALVFSQLISAPTANLCCLFISILWARPGCETENQKPRWFCFRYGDHLGWPVCLLG